VFWCEKSQLTFDRVSAALRRVHLVTWQPYMDECLEILENHPDALPSDRKLTWWAKLGLIMEDSGHHFSSEDSEPISTFANSKLWYNMKVFEDRLAQWREEIPRDIYTGLSPFLGPGFNLLTIL
jgi:hypothetical protein